MSCKSTSNGREYTTGELTTGSLGYAKFSSFGDTKNYMDPMEIYRYEFDHTFKATFFQQLYLPVTSRVM